MARKLPESITVCVCLFLAALVVLSALSGCSQVDDFTAQMIGAPTRAQIDAAASQLEQAEESAAVLADKLQEIQQAQVTAQQARDTASAQAKQVQQALAQVGVQLAQADPGTPVYAALSATYDSLRGQMNVLLGQADQAAQVVVQYGTQIASLKAASESNAKIIGQARADLDQYSADTDAAISAAGDTVTQAGKLAGDLGIPGVAPIAATVGSAVTGLLGIVFGARQRQKAKQTQTAAKEIVASIDTAKKANPDFAQAFGAVREIIASVQSEGAKALVDQAQGKAVSH